MAPSPSEGSEIFCDRLELVDRHARLARQRPETLLEAMVDMIVDQRLLGVGDRLLDGVELLDEIEAAALGLDHRDDLAQMPFGPLQPVDDGGRGRVRRRVHYRNLSPWRGYVERRFDRVRRTIFVPRMQQAPAARSRGGRSARSCSRRGPR